MFIQCTCIIAHITGVGQYPSPASSGQLEEDSRLFQFLKSDVPGDIIAIDTEEETFLSELEPYLVEPRTLFF